MLCWSSREETPHAQGNRNPSKTVGVARGHQRADTLKPYSQNRTTALSNSIKLSHALRATQDGGVMVERSDRMWSTGEGNGNPLQYSCLENPMNSMKRQNDRIPKEEFPRFLCNIALYSIGSCSYHQSHPQLGIVFLCLHPFILSGVISPLISRSILGIH